MPPTNSQPASSRRFEFVEGASNKFWQVTVKGTEVTVCFGRNGTNGQTNTKSFADAGAAQNHADKMIREKTAKGYVEVIVLPMRRAAPLGSLIAAVA